MGPENKFFMLFKKYSNKSIIEFDWKFISTTY